MGRFRKKPVEIEAFELTQAVLDSLGAPHPGERAVYQAAPAWAQEKMRPPIDQDEHFGAVWIDTLEGPVKAWLGYFILKGVQGEVYPCAADIFRATYDPVGE